MLVLLFSIPSARAPACSPPAYPFGPDTPAGISTPTSQGFSPSPVARAASSERTRLMGGAGFTHSVTGKARTPPSPPRRRTKAGGNGHESNLLSGQRQGKAMTSENQPLSRPWPQKTAGSSACPRASLRAGLNRGQYGTGALLLRPSRHCSIQEPLDDVLFDGRLLLRAEVQELNPHARRIPLGRVHGAAPDHAP